jgi:PKD repeat protein
MLNYEKKYLLLLAMIFLMLESFGQCGTILTGGPTVFCGPGCNGSVTFQSSSGTPPYTLIVTGGPTVQYSSFYTWANICPGSYPYSVTDATSSCSDNGTITIVSNPLPVINVTPPSANICIGDSVLLIPSGALSYSWSPMSYYNLVSGYFSPPATTVYTVVGTDANGCTGSASVTVALNPNPILPFPPPAFMCLGGSLVICASGADTYLWSPATALSSVTDSCPTASPIQTTVYTVIGTNLSSGCTSSTTVTVNVFPPPAITLQVTNESCVGCCDGVINVSGCSNCTYQWSYMPCNITMPCNNLCSGTYSITAVDANGCANNASATLATGNCSASFTMYPTGNPHDYYVVNSSTGALPLTYDWDWGDGSPHDLIAFPIHTYASAGVYNITLNITDNVGCTNMQTSNSYLSRMEQMLTVTVVPQLPTGGAEAAGEEVFIYPNPVAEKFFVDYDPLPANGKISIYNSLGEKILAQNILSAQTEINLIDQPGGIYFVAVQTEEGIVSRKIILSK